MGTVTNETKTLSDIRRIVYFMLSENANSTIFKKDDVNSAINIALATVYKVANRAKRRITTNTITGIREYEIPDASLQFGRALVNEVLIDGTSVSPTSVAEESPSASDGKPSSFYVDGNTVGLSPTPDNAYALSVLYSMEYSELTEDTKKTGLADVFINAAVLYVCYLLKLKDEEFGSADRFSDAYDKAIKSASMIQSGLYRGTESRITYGGSM